MSITEAGPFGNPDGAKAALEEIQDGFVTFPNQTIWGGLAIRKNDRTARVIVGRKGSGKTIYLRRLRADAADEESLYADTIRQDVPSTETIIRFCQLYTEDQVDEAWTGLWHCSILSSVVAHLLNAPMLKDKVAPVKAEQLRKDYRSILLDYKAPVSPYSQLTRIIGANYTRNQIRKYFNDPMWPQLEWVIADIIKDCPPLCFYIDTVDEHFENAPMYWLKCQVGLFLETMKLVRNHELGGRLHVFICIRDIVLSSILRSEHSTRYLTEPHIRMLDWNKNAIRLLLTRKIEMLDDELFLLGTENGKNLHTWLGLKEIYNPSRDINEPIEQYIIRHTRLLPRDVIIMGNHICSRVQQALNLPTDKKIDVVIRQAVSETARFLGNEQLFICANQITSNSMPKDAGRRGYSDIYTGNKMHVRGVTDDLKKVINRIGKDRFSGQELQQAKTRATDLFGEDPKCFSVLWQNGLLGYTERREESVNTVFFSEERMDDFNLPQEKDEYVFHSCLIDSVGIKSVGKEPVT
jgi:hypothetical protein